MIDEKTKKLLTTELKRDSCSVFESLLLTTISRGNVHDIISQSVVFNAPHLLKEALLHTDYSAEKYYQALYSAVIYGNLPCVEVLWEKSQSSAEQQYNLLKQSMLHKKVDVAHYLLQQGADPSDKDQTLLALCACQRYETLVEALLEKCDHKSALDSLRREFMHCYNSWQWFENMMTAREQKRVLQDSLSERSIKSSLRKM